LRLRRRTVEQLVHLNDVGRLLRHLLHAQLEALEPGAELAELERAALARRHQPEDEAPDHAGQHHDASATDVLVATKLFD